MLFHTPSAIKAQLLAILWFFEVLPGITQIAQIWYFWGIMWKIISLTRERTGHLLGCFCFFLLSLLHFWKKNSKCVFDKKQKTQEQNEISLFFEIFLPDMQSRLVRNTLQKKTEKKTTKFNKLISCRVCFVTRVTTNYFIFCTVLHKTICHQKSLLQPLDAKKTCFW